MSVTSRMEELRDDVTDLASSAATSSEFMQPLCCLLHYRMLKYSRVGFYMIESRERPMLGLGAFAGAMTPHTRIPLDQGICGAAASSGQTIVVEHLNQDPRYLVCSLATNCEIVAPVFADGKVVGELDIDSHFPAAFIPDDQQRVQHCAVLVAKDWKARSHEG